MTRDKAMKINKYVEDLKQEYAKIVFPKLSEASYISLLVVFVVIALSLLINLTDSAIGIIFNYIMFKL